MNYILDNHLEDAVVDCIDDITFEVPIQQVYVYKVDTTDTLEYRAFGNVTWHNCDGNRIAEMVSDKEANMLRGIE